MLSDKTEEVEEQDYDAFLDDEHDYGMSDHRDQSFKDEKINWDLDKTK